MNTNTTTTLTDIQRKALELMSNDNVGAIAVSGYGWLFPTHIRNDYGRFGQKRAEAAAAAIVKRLGGGN